MTSILLFIASAIALVAGIAYFVFTYAPFVINFWNNVVQSFQVITELFPEWLVPYLWIPITLGVIGILIKVL